jgi:hypothetical protein
MNVLNLRAIPIAISKLDYSLNKKQKEFIIKQNYQKGSSVKVSENNYIFNNKIFKNIKDLFDKKIDQYLKQVLQIKNEVYITQSWTTINDNTVHHSHSHKGAFLSIVFYPESKGNNNLYFELGKSSIQEGFDFSYNPIHYNIYNSESWYLPTNEKDLFIFPGWIKHHSVNEGSKIMIGANYFLKGDLGEKNRKDFLYLK